MITWLQCQTNQGLHQISKDDRLPDSPSVLLDHPVTHRLAVVSEKWVVVHLSGWDPHVSTNGKRYFSAKTTLSHSSFHLKHLLSLSLLTQEQARTLETREGRDWWKDWRWWRRGRREAPAAAHGHPSLLNPHGKLKKFLSSSIIQQLHGLSFDSPFGIFAWKSSYQVKSWMDGEVGMEKVWIFKFLAMEALKSQS